jgi:hypothetical protein
VREARHIMKSKDPYSLLVRPVLGVNPSSQLLQKSRGASTAVELRVKRSSVLAQHDIPLWAGTYASSIRHYIKTKHFALVTNTYKIPHR